MMEYQKYNFGHDAHDFATGKLRTLLNSQDKTLRFRSPFGFGASPGPRRPLGLQSTDNTIRSLRQKNPETHQTLSVRFKTSRTYLENLLPPGFAFTSPGTLAAASISATTLSNMAWLAGGGYSHAGLYIHGVNYTKKDGSKTFGTYLAVLFENAADPIITGRDELGMPKLFCEIEARVEGENASISLSSRGTTFGKISVSGLATPQPTPSPPAPAQRMPGPPPPPPEQGTFWQRYVPSVGEPGKADADYAVFNPNPEPAAEGDAAPETLTSATGSVAFEAGDWESLPTLHHVAKGLAEMPVYGVEEAKVVRGQGVGDVSAARRIE